jgi:hypothetical protein
VGVLEEVVSLLAVLAKFRIAHTSQTAGEWPYFLLPRRVRPGLPAGVDGCAHECCEVSEMFWSLDNFQVLSCELVQRDEAFAYIEESDVIRSYDEIGLCSGVTVLDVDSLG